MLQCFTKFCSNPEIKTEANARDCRQTILKNKPDWKGNCFYQRDGAGCEECGGRTVRGSSCMHCLSCGWSPCG